MTTRASLESLLKASLEAESNKDDDKDKKDDDQKTAAEVLADSQAAAAEADANAAADNGQGTGEQKPNAEEEAAQAAEAAANADAAAADATQQAADDAAAAAAATGSDTNASATATTGDDAASTDAAAAQSEAEAELAAAEADNAAAASDDAAAAAAAGDESGAADAAAQAAAAAAVADAAAAEDNGAATGGAVTGAEGDLGTGTVTAGEVAEVSAAGAVAEDAAAAAAASEAQAEEAAAAAAAVDESTANVAEAGSATSEASAAATVDEAAANADAVAATADAPATGSATSTPAEIGSEPVVIGVSQAEQGASEAVTITPPAADNATVQEPGVDAVLNTSELGAAASAAANAGTDATGQAATGEAEGGAAPQTDELNSGVSPSQGEAGMGGQDDSVNVLPVDTELLSDAISTVTNAAANQTEIMDIEGKVGRMEEVADIVDSKIADGTLDKASLEGYQAALVVLIESLDLKPDHKHLFTAMEDGSFNTNGARALIAHVKGFLADQKKRVQVAMNKVAANIFVIAGSVSKRAKNAQAAVAKAQGTLPEGAVVKGVDAAELYIGEPKVGTPTEILDAFEDIIGIVYDKVIAQLNSNYSGVGKWLANLSLINNESFEADLAKAKTVLPLYSTLFEESGLEGVAQRLGLAIRDTGSALRAPKDASPAVAYIYEFAASLGKDVSTKRTGAERALASVRELPALSLEEARVVAERVEKLANAIIQKEPSYLGILSFLDEKAVLRALADSASEAENSAFRRQLPTEILSNDNAQAYEDLLRAIDYLAETLASSAFGPQVVLIRGLNELVVWAERSAALYK